MASCQLMLKRSGSCGGYLPRRSWRFLHRRIRPQHDGVAHLDDCGNWLSVSMRISLRMDELEDIIYLYPQSP